MGVELAVCLGRIDSHSSGNLADAFATVLVNGVPIDVGEMLGGGRGLSASVGSAELQRTHIRASGCAVCERAFMRGFHAPQGREDPDVSDRACITLSRRFMYSGCFFLPHGTNPCLKACHTRSAARFLF